MSGPVTGQDTAGRNRGWPVRLQSPLVSATGHWTPPDRTPTRQGLTGLSQAHGVLTGLLSRRAMLRVPADMKAAATAGQPIFVTLFDIDPFEHINVVYGHLAGVEVLAELGSRLRANVEAGSHIGRSGGATKISCLPP